MEICSRQQKRQNVWSARLGRAPFQHPSNGKCVFILMFPKPPWSQGVKPCDAGSQKAPGRSPAGRALLWSQPSAGKPPSLLKTSLSRAVRTLLMIVLLLANTALITFQRTGSSTGFCSKHPPPRCSLISIADAIAGMRCPSLGGLGKGRGGDGHPKMVKALGQPWCSPSGGRNPFHLRAETSQTQTFPVPNGPTLLNK